MLILRFFLFLFLFCCYLPCLFILHLRGLHFRLLPFNEPPLRGCAASIALRQQRARTHHAALYRSSLFYVGDLHVYVWHYYRLYHLPFPTPLRSTLPAVRCCGMRWFVGSTACYGGLFTAFTTCARCARRPVTTYLTTTYCFDSLLFPTRTLPTLLLCIVPAIPLLPVTLPPYGSSAIPVLPSTPSPPQPFPLPLPFDIIIVIPGSPRFLLPQHRFVRYVLSFPVLRCRFFTCPLQFPHTHWFRLV